MCTANVTRTCAHAFLDRESRTAETERDRERDREIEREKEKEIERERRQIDAKASRGVDHRRADD